jgi:hypothetical protein
MNIGHHPHSIFRSEASVYYGLKKSVGYAPRSGVNNVGNFQRSNQKGSMINTSCNNVLRNSQHQLLKYRKKDINWINSKIGSCRAFCCKRRNIYWTLSRARIISFDTAKYTCEPRILHFWCIFETTTERCCGGETLWNCFHPALTP